MERDVGGSRTGPVLYVVLTGVVAAVISATVVLAVGADDAGGVDTPSTTTTLSELTTTTEATTPTLRANALTPFDCQLGYLVVVPDEGGQGSASSAVRELELPSLIVAPGICAGDTGATSGSTSPPLPGGGGSASPTTDTSTSTTESTDRNEHAETTRALIIGAFASREDAAYVRDLLRDRVPSPDMCVVAAKDLGQLCSTEDGSDRDNGEEES